MNVDFLLVDRAANMVVRRCSVPAEAFLPPPEDGQEWVEVPHADSWGLNEAGAPVYQPATLDELRAATWEQVKRLRSAYESAGCETALGRVDTTAESQLRITGAALAAQVALAAGQPFVLPWTMADNSVVDHDAAAMIAMGETVLAYVAACHARGRVLRAAIEAAEDQAALGAIDITEGWPA